MNVFWLTPAAWWGLFALALPILIHLLTRQARRRVLFPSLRFLHATRVAALHRRSPQDWPLLAVRLLLLAAAVAGLAGPVFVSAARRAEWSTRVSRGFVVVPGSSGFERLLQDERQTSFASAVFTPAVRLSDGLGDADAWLQRQPPSAHEIVIVGDVREGVLHEHDLSAMSPTAGIRFLIVPATGADPVVEIPTLHGGDQRLDGLPIEVRAAVSDQPYANAALRAVLARGLPLDVARSRRLIVAFDGAEGSDRPVRQPADAIWMREALEQLPDLAGGQSGDTLVVFAKQRAEGETVPALIERVARAAFAEDLRNFETRRASAVALAGWSRPPSGIRYQPPGTRDQVPGTRHEGHEGEESEGSEGDAGRLRLTDEGDRRWLWGVVLVLLLLETLLRRSPARGRENDVEEEARVA